MQLKTFKMDKHFGEKLSIKGIRDASYQNANTPLNYEKKW